MLPVMTRLKVHHLVSDGGLQQQTVADKLGIHVSSVERILREPAPTPQEVASNVRHGRRGRPSLVDAFRTRVVELLKETPDLPGAEVLRLARGWGYVGKRSALYELIAAVRPPAKREPVILFDGARGEFAQFDFGETWVKFGDGRRLKVTFFAGRLKFSRYARVVVTPNQQAETLIRSLLTWSDRTLSPPEARFPRKLRPQGCAPGPSVSRSHSLQTFRTKAVGISGHHMPNASIGWGGLSDLDGAGRRLDFGL